MPRPRSKQTQAALDDIAAGMSQAAAAKKHGVDQGLLSRMRRPKEPTVTIRLTRPELIRTIGLWREELYGVTGDCSILAKLETAISRIKCNTTT